MSESRRPFTAVLATVRFGRSSAAAIPPRAPSQRPARQQPSGDTPVAWASPLAVFGMDVVHDPPEEEAARNNRISKGLLRGPPWGEGGGGSDEGKRRGECRVVLDIFFCILPNALRPRHVDVAPLERARCYSHRFRPLATSGPSSRVRRGRPEGDPMTRQGEDQASGRHGFSRDRVGGRVAPNSSGGDAREGQKKPISSEFDGGGAEGDRTPDLLIAKDVLPGRSIGAKIAFYYFKALGRS